MSAAFAVKDATGILIKTVSDTERAAKVNWLFCYGRYMVTEAASDDQIARAFRSEQLKLPAGRCLEVVPVVVSETLQ